MSNGVEILVKQTADTYQWVNRLVDSIPVEKWEEIPTVVETNVSWQIGHLIVSFYYHSILVIVGHQMDLLQKIPLKQYSELFTVGIPPHAIGKIDPRLLREHLNGVQAKSLEVIQALSAAQLDSALEPSPIPHPIAQTKWEALDWNIKHSMYHCGQLGLLKRIVDKRFDFGLRVK